MNDKQNTSDTENENRAELSEAVMTARIEEFLGRC